MHAVPLPTPDDVLAARERLDPYLEPTPLVESAALGALLKLETVQPTGSFKVRGAFSALTLLPEGAPVVTASAGNHGLGVAYAAETLELPAMVVCPATASSLKLEKLRQFPIELLLAGETYDAAEAAALELGRQGRCYVSAYNDPAVIAGQGTIAIELLEALEGPLTILVPTGGGGLLSGVALWATQRPGVRVVGVESAASPALRAALDAGGIVPIEVLPSLADGLSGNLEPGSMTVDLVRSLVDDVVVVGEDDVAWGMRFLWREHAIVAEGSGAIAVGALLAGRVERAGQTVCLVTGRNVAEDVLAQVLEST
jgi:threonine dehydratase